MVFVRRGSLFGGGLLVRFDCICIYVASVCKLCGSLKYFAHFSTCYPWVYVQPGTGKRPVDCCRNIMFYSS